MAVIAPSKDLRAALVKQQEAFVPDPAPQPSAARPVQGPAGHNVPAVVAERAAIVAARRGLRNAKQERITARFVRFRRGLKRSGWEVRAVFYLVHKSAGFTTRLIIRYADARAFVKAHFRGKCSADVQVEREAVCDGCGSQSTYDGTTFCGECNCGATPRAAIRRKTSLAGFACTLGRFDTAPGWLARTIQAVSNKVRGNGV